MADEVTNDYGFQDDEVKVSPFNFGLNAGKTFLTKFEWTPTGGKEGTEQEALDVVFTINDTTKNYRLFPVTKAFLKDGGETTDRTTPEFKDAVKDFNAKVFHIVHCFVELDTYKVAVSRKIDSFKDFCSIVASLLPKDYNKKPLDVFMQFQWQPSEGKNRTYLELPKNMKHGKWVITAQAGAWNKKVVENADDSEREALTYVNEKDEKHPFTRSGWFMNNNFAKQQSDDAQGEAVTENTGTNVAEQAAAQNAAPAAVENW